MANAEVTVSVEKAVHDSLRDLAQRVWDQHGISIQDVRFEWLDVSTPGKADMQCMAVRANTLTKR